MWGKKARVYYHGIPLFCVQCHTIGHSKSDCDGNTATWRDYIKKLTGFGIKPELFGAWLSSNLSFSRESQVVPQPKFNRKSNEADDESDIDFDNLPPNVLKLIRKFQSSTPRTSANNSVASSKKTSPPSNNKKALSVNRGRGKPNSRDIVKAAKIRRGRGRGRGRGQPNP